MDAVESLELENEDQKIGAEIVTKALRQPAFHIAANAGVDAARIVEKALRESGENFNYFPNYLNYKLIRIE